MKTNAKPLFYSIQERTFPRIRTKPTPLKAGLPSAARLESRAERVIMRGFLNLGTHVRTYRSRVKRTKLRNVAGER